LKKKRDDLLFVWTVLVQLDTTILLEDSIKYRMRSYLTTNALEGLKVVDIIERIYATLK